MGTNYFHRGRVNLPLFLASVITPDSVQIEYGYDENHNLTQVTDYSGYVIRHI